MKFIETLLNGLSAGSTYAMIALGYTMVGEADGVAGVKFEAAVQAFQGNNHCWVDGEITACNKTWRKLLGME